MQGQWDREGASSVYVYSLTTREFHPWSETKVPQAGQKKKGKKRMENTNRAFCMLGIVLTPSEIS